jgi:hypothetical protein
MSVVPPTGSWKARSYREDMKKHLSKRSEALWVAVKSTKTQEEAKQIVPRWKSVEEEWAAEEKVKNDKYAALKKERGFTKHFMRTQQQASLKFRNHEILDVYGYYKKKEKAPEEGPKEKISQSNPKVAPEVSDAATDVSGSSV